MTISIEEMKSEAMALSVGDRAKLAHELIISLEETNKSDIQESWNKEIKKRVFDIKNGTAKGRPAEQVLAEIRAKYK